MIGEPMVLGLLGGLLVAVTFTLLFQLQTRGFTLPTTPLWNRYVGRLTFGKYLLPGAPLLHLLVGALSGSLFPVLVSDLIGLPSAYLTTFPQALTAGLGYGVALYALSRVAELLGLVSLGESGQSQRLFEYNVLYGLGLGVWFGLAEWIGYPLICQLFVTVCPGT